MDGRETYRYATRTIASTALNAIERAGWTADQVDLFIPHQANERIIESVAKGLGIPMDRIFLDLDRYGNTSAASVPIALAEAVDEGRVRPGDPHRVRGVRCRLHEWRGGDHLDRRPRERPKGGERAAGGEHPSAPGLGRRRPGAGAGRADPGRKQQTEVPA